MSTVAHWGYFTNLEEESDEIHDLSGHCNTGTLDGDTSFNLIGARGRVLNFNTSYVQIPDSTSLDVQSTISIGAWIYKTDSLRAMVVDKDQSYRLWFPLDDNKPAFCVHCGGVWREFVAPNLVVPTNQWVFLQACYDATAGILQIYCQGSLNCENTSFNYGVINNTSYRVFLGDYAWGGYQFKGYMGEVIIKNEVLDLDTHRTDLKKWLKRRAGRVIECLELHIGGGVDPILITTQPESITMTVENVLGI